MILRVWVDSEVCLAHGLCVVVCPEVFEFRPDSKYGGVSIKPDAEKFYPTHGDAIREAWSCCPVDAIHVEQRE